MERAAARCECGRGLRLVSPAKLAVAPPAAVSLQGVSVRRSGRDILSGVSASIPAGAVTAVLGRSGAGKTTLLRVLNGLISPDAGTVDAAGFGSLHSPEALKEYRRGTATVFQDPALLDRLSALENVLLGLADRRHPLSPLPWPKALREKAAQALDEVGLLPRAQTPVARLSGGERQRVGVARARVRRARLLLADEPFASADPATARHLSQELRGAAVQAGLTLVIVLHQVELALSMADHVLGLREGRLAFSGPVLAFDAAAQRRLFQFSNA